MKKTLRTFLAVETSSAVRASVAELIDTLSQSPANVKWVETDNLHLTLKFLDEVRVDEIPRICEAVARGVAGAEPFLLEIFGVGAFPNAGRPRTIWLGARGGGEQMIALHQLVETALGEIGFRKEHRRFQPHLTIGRVRYGGAEAAALGDLLWEHAQFEVGTVSVREVVVFSSQLDRAGPVYTVLGRAPLRGA
jgi:RNA 2',3'-cyclic 3'-phosphodiesterase